MESRTYSVYEECSQFKGWLVINGEQSRYAREKLKKSVDKLIASTANRSDYLIDGCIVSDQDASLTTVDNGWSYRLFAETKKGLEKIAKKLRLPV